jgi:hypothetical protein
LCNFLQAGGKLRSFQLLDRDATREGETEVCDANFATHLALCRCYGGFSERAFLLRHFDSPSTLTSDLDWLIEEQALVWRVASNAEERGWIRALPGHSDTRHRYRSLGACSLQIKILFLGAVNRIGKCEYLWLLRRH